MKTSIKATKFKLTDAMRDVILKKMDLLDPKVRRFGDVVEAKVEVARTTAHHNKGDVYRAEVQVRLPGKLVYAAAEGEDLYQAFNEARQEATRQIRAAKEMYEDKKKGKRK